jgi:type II secretory pathway component PulF
MLNDIVITSLVLLTLGAALRTATRLLYGARGPAPDDIVHLMMRVLGWCLISAPLVVLAIGGINWLSLILIFAVGQALIELLLARRAAQRLSLWRLIVAAVGDRQPLADTLRVHQRRFSGIVGRALRRLIRNLDRGDAWPAAIRDNRRAVPREAPAFAAVMARGQTANRLLTADDFFDPLTQQMQQQAVQRFNYLATVALMMVGVLTFVMVSIVPSFQAIFEDFDLELPAITRSIIGFSNTLVGPLAPVLVLMGLILGVAVLIAFICELSDVPILTPATDRLWMFRHRARVMKLLAASIGQGATIDETLHHLCSGVGRYPSRAVRRRLVKARKLVISGGEWQASLEQAGLASASDVAVLRAAQAAGNLSWALRLMSERTVRIATFRWSIVHQFIFVALVLVLGLFVFWFAVAMIVPLADLINNLSG